MIELKNINLSFDGKKILDNFSLKVDEGEKIALKGPSGSGKTSILNLIMHFINADSGFIYINGEKQSKANIMQIRRDITWLPQNTSIFGKGTVKEVMLRPFNFSTNQNIIPTIETLSENLTKVGLTDDILNNKIEDISGGEKQRIGLVISKLLKRPIMLLDEPTSALDRASKDMAIDYLFNGSDQTILATSHDDVFLERCQRVIEL
jgi:putative ABC transport system ATP-binding protein